MDLNHIKQAYFLGIGGIGMSAIARYFHQMGIAVSGYDKTETTLTKELASEGIQIHYEDLGASLGKFNLDVHHCIVVLTPAVPKDHQEWKWLRDNGFTIKKRSEVLGLITDAYKTIGVAGTHGKTTTSTLIAHILKQSKLDCAAFLGGISTNYNSNLLLHQAASEPLSSQCMVVEADEFDRSFLTLHPSIGIITSTDADHLDIYGEHDALKKSFADYAAQVKDMLIIKKELNLFSDCKNNKQFDKVKLISYSISSPADVYADNIRIEGAQYQFDLHYQNHTLPDLQLGIPGLHNVENAVAASAAALSAGVSKDELRNALASFKGVKRRFEYIINTPELVYIDDYAHHPEELKATIGSVRQMYPGKKITVAFQPHLYSRTRDFADGFASSLSLADEVFLLDIYPARELPIPGVTSEMIFKNITSAFKQCCTLQQATELITAHQPELLLTLGAGDIDQLVEPIKVELSKHLPF